MTKRMNIPFSPPDMTEREVEAVGEVLRSGWITTGPKTKELERRMAEFTHTKRGACLNSATACMETALRPVSYTHLDVYKRQVLYILRLIQQLVVSIISLLVHSRII